MFDNKELSKVVKVSDPENWYDQKSVIVKLFICPEYKGSTDVRILVVSIDDFAMEYTRTCYTQAGIDCTYNLMKEHMFDTIPKKISCKWLYEHRFFPI